MVLKTLFKQQNNHTQKKNAYQKKNVLTFVKKKKCFNWILLQIIFWEFAMRQLYFPLLNGNM